MRIEGVWDPCIFERIVDEELIESMVDSSICLYEWIDVFEFG